MTRARGDEEMLEEVEEEALGLAEGSFKKLVIEWNGPDIVYTTVKAYMQKAGDTGDISPQIFLDFPQNFRLRTRNQYCTQAIA